MALPPEKYNEDLRITRESLHGSEERFRLLVEQVSEYAMFILDVTGHVTTWNRGAERIKGYQGTEIIGQHFSKFYRSEDRWKCEVELETATRLGRVEDEGWRVRKDGSLFWANVVITRLQDSQGVLVGFAKVTRDLTDRHRAELALRESEERFRLLVESVKDYAIFRLDPHGFVATWNIGAERIKGYRAHEIIGEHFSRFYPDEDVRAGVCESKLEVAVRDGRVEDEGWRLRKDGSRFWANVIITHLTDRTGKTVGFAKVTRDLTERVAAEAARVRLGQEARIRVSHFAALSEALAGASTTLEVGRVVTEHGTSFAQADLCTLHLLDESSMALELVAERGTDPNVVEQIRRITPDAGNPAYAIAVSGAPEAWIESREQYEAYLPAIARMPGEGPRSVAFFCLPLVAEGRTIGLIGVGYHQARQFSADERDFFRTFARQSAQGLARARRLEAERAAAALAERLRASLATTLRSVGDALIATDATGAVSLMNGVAEALTGWSEAEAQGRSLPEVFRIINEYTRAVVPNPVEKVLESGGIVGLANHTLLLSRDGREIPIDDSGAPIRSEHGPIEGVVLVFRDVTERKREESRRALLVEASSALAQSLDYEITLGRVAELAVPRLADGCAIDLVDEGERVPKRVAVAHVDPGKIELVKQLAQRPLFNAAGRSGLGPVSPSGQPELLPRISDELLVARCIDEEHLRIARELGLVSVMTVPLVARTQVFGALTFISAESSRTFSEDDLKFAEELAHRCASAVENARAYRAEQRARLAADLANRSKDEFLAVVSHELRTPLNAIMGWAKMLTMQGVDETRLKRAHEIIERNSVAMAQLIEDLLDMSRVISGKLRMEVQPLDVSAVIDAAIESVRPAALAKTIELHPLLDTTVPSILGDSGRLQQVVWNLLSNAVKFTPRGGRVTVVLRRVSSSIEISVTDDGQGIDPAFLPHVFEAFRQQDSGPARQRGGLGLGLAITRQLVELHGGRITALSDGEGRGSTFTVTLPISAVANSTARASRHIQPTTTDSTYHKPEHIRGLHVLVVDDEEDARRLIATILEDCGCRVEMASSLDEALAKITQSPPDVLLSDVGMPGGTGFDLIRQVRSLPHDRGGDIPAAAITAYARPEDRRSLLNAGYSIHLPKPVEPAELVAVVATLTRFIRRA